MKRPSLLFILLILIFFIPTQTLLLEGIKIGGVKPDLGLILSYFIGLAWGPQSGLMGGLLLGGLQDVFSIGRLGLHSVLKGLTGGGVGLLETFFLYFSLPAHALVIFFVSMLHDLIGALILHGIMRGLTVLSFTTVGQAFYNGIITMAFLFMLSRQRYSRDPWMEKRTR